MTLRFYLNSIFYTMLASTLLITPKLLGQNTKGVHFIPLNKYPICSKHVKAKDVLTQTGAHYERSSVGNLSQYHGFVSCIWRVYWEEIGKSLQSLLTGEHEFKPAAKACMKNYNCQVEIDYSDPAECMAIAEDTIRHRFADTTLPVNPDLCNTPKSMGYEWRGPHLCYQRRLGSNASSCNTFYALPDITEIIRNDPRARDTYVGRYMYMDNPREALGCNVRVTREYFNANWKRVCPDNPVTYFGGAQQPSNPPPSNPTYPQPQQPSYNPGYQQPPSSGSSPGSGGFNHLDPES